MVIIVQNGDNSSMVKLTSPPTNLNSPAHDFKLLGADNNYYTLNDVHGENGLLVMFICNHCPYVQAILNQIVEDTNELIDHGINSVGIMPNDVSRYPQDSLENMRKLAEAKSFPFPYLIDSKQSTARNYNAVCTPDFFVFDGDKKLKYRGRLRGENNEKELINTIIKKKADLSLHKPSIGCSIKWIEP